MINNYFDHIYCLNLDRRVDKWKRVSSHLKSFGIKANRFIAVDGNTEENIRAYKDIRAKYPTASKILGKKTIRSPGAYGCLLSHRNIISHAKRNNFKRILIFQDDVILDKNFNKKFRDKVLRIPKWKLLYLGASQHDWSGVSIRNGFMYNAWRSQGAFALGIDRSLFDSILRVTEKCNIPFDSSVSAFIQTAHKEHCYVLYPNIAIADVSSSDIRKVDNNMRDYAKLVRWNLNNF